MYRPATGRRPAILFRTPYDRGFLAQHSRELEPVRAAEAGFAVVIQDVRGRGGSGGTYDFLASDADDGADSLAWVARQPWCDGRVVMAGGSYNGIVQLLAAADAPRLLRAIAPRLCGSPYRIWYPGGVLDLGLTAAWIEVLAEWELARREERGYGDSGERRRLRALADASPIELVHTLVDDDETWLRQLAPHAYDWVCHDTLDDYWSRFHVVDRLDPALPGLHVSGWYDVCLEATLETYEALNGSSAQHLIVGPWSHGNTHGVFPEHSFGRDAGADASDLMGEQLSFFAHYLAEHDGGPPAVRAFVMGEDRWRVYDRWPPPGVEERTWYLRPSVDRENATGCRGRLTEESPDDELPYSYEHDPGRPVPTMGGATFLRGAAVAANSGPRDQSAIGERPDVLAYTGELLAKPIHVAGRARVTLSAQTDAVDTDFMVKLIDVYPDGRALGVSEGVVQVRSGNGMRRAEPNRIHECALSLGSTNYTFARGHRLRIHVCSSDFPRFYPNPGTGDRLRDGPPQRYVTARQLIHHSRVHPSTLVLPTLPA